MDRVIPMQNQNKFLFVVSPDLHHVPMRSAHAVLHLARYKFVVHLMAHFHVEIRMANDDDRLSKKHATTMGMSKQNIVNDLNIVKIYFKKKYTQIMHKQSVCCLPFHDRFVLLVVVSLLEQSSIRRRPFSCWFCVSFFY